jgi:hypothetical protein
MKSVAFVVLALLTAAASARADEKTPVIVVHNQVIHARAARPTAVAEVARVPVASTLGALRQPLVRRIAPTVARAPF